MCPTHLSKAAKKEWKRIAPELEKLGLLSHIDMAALAAYCQAYGRWVEAEKKLKEIGHPLYKSKNGTVTTSPWLWVANKALDQILKFASEFGMTPSARTRIHVEKPKEDEEVKLDRFLKQKAS